MSRADEYHASAFDILREAGNGFPWFAEVDDETGVMTLAQMDRDEAYNTGRWDNLSDTPEGALRLFMERTAPGV